MLVLFPFWGKNAPKQVYPLDQTILNHCAAQKWWNNGTDDDMLWNGSEEDGNAKS